MDAVMDFITIVGIGTFIIVAILGPKIMLVLGLVAIIVWWLFMRGHS